MKSIKLSVIVNSFFIFISTLFFFYAVFFYNGRGFTLSLLLSSTFAVISSGIYVIIALYKGELLESKFSLENNILNFNYYLFLNSKTEILKLLRDYYTFKKVETTLCEDYLTIINSDAKIFSFIKPEEITLSEIINITKKYGNNKIVILGVDFSSDVIKAIQKLNLNISLVKTKDLYFSLKDANLLPELNVYEIKKQKLNLKTFYNKIFDKNNAKKFLITGIVLTVTSLFTFYPIYYLISGTALMLISIVLRLKKETSTNANNALDNIVVK